MYCPKCRGRRRWPLSLSVVAGLVLASAALAEAPLSLDEAGRLALARQPLLAAGAATAAALREEAVAAAQPPDPRLTLGVEALPADRLSLTREDMTQTVIGLSQAIPGGDKLALAGRRLAHEASRADHALAAEARRVTREAGLAWLELYAAERALALANAIAAEYEREVDWSRTAYQAGQLGQADSLALRAELEAARNRAAGLAGRRAAARAGLVRWLGEAGRRPIAELDGPAAPPGLAELSARLDDHPELLALQAGLEAGRVEGELARQAYKPDWNIDLGYGIRGGGRADLVSLMVGVDLPLFPARRQDRRLAARLAEVERMQAMLEDRRRELAAELAAAWADWQSADDRLRRLDGDILPLAARRVDSTLAAYQTATAGYDAVLAARRAGLAARLERLDLAVARARAAVTLRYFE